MPGEVVILKIPDAITNKIASALKYSLLHNRKCVLRSYTPTL